ncbi:alpha/beta hydrolase [Actinomadura craniellae]|uniref:Alpha/beta hydrolase n=1 Tax=Actinomadura craniellae TaxID=2231787 RepID=A0A365HAK6_9ACTN|nr:alpha/beta hydrolase [Actinomadura craniellae]RAY16038.1 alpha/beta hydrolase [Actinomadura craniellae]
MPVPPRIEERPGCGRGARLAARLARLLLLPAFSRLSWRPWALRWAWTVDALAFPMIAPRGTRRTRVTGLGCAAEWVRGPRVAPDSRRVILYFHGGGFVACGLRTHRRMIARISTAAGMPALAVAYRKPPRVTIGETVEDCVRAYRHLLDQGYRPGDVVVAGDSAGGYLAFVATLHALRAGLPRPAGIVGLSPFLDLDGAARLAHPCAATDPFIPAGRLGRMVAAVFPGVEPADPRLAPVRADLGGLPPVLIQAGGIEVLRVDAELMAERLGAANVPCTLQIWAGQMHVFQIFADLAREGLAAIGEIGDFARAVTAEGPARAA